MCADIDGFSLHAAVRCKADERAALEQLCRYITRPAPANERVQCNAAGQVVLKLKRPWRDGTTHLVMSPLEFMQRLAALVPRPRLHPVKPQSADARLLGSAAPGLLRTEAKRRKRRGKPVIQPAMCVLDRGHRHSAATVDHKNSDQVLDRQAYRPFVDLLAARLEGSAL